MIRFEQEGILFLEPFVCLPPNNYKTYYKKITDLSKVGDVAGSGMAYKRDQVCYKQGINDIIHVIRNVINVITNVKHVIRNVILGISTVVNMIKNVIHLINPFPQAQSLKKLVQIIRP